MKHLTNKIRGGVIASALAVFIVTPAFSEGPTVSGYVDFGYQYNLNTPAAGENTDRVFDGQDNSFTLHNMELDVEGSGDGFTYRVDLAMGNDAAASQQSGTTVDGDKIDLQQAFVTFPCPVLPKGSFTAGKFVTLLGREVIEANANLNYSRSYLFGYSIPFAHTGVKYDYGFSDSVKATVGMTNGWGETDDSNESKAFLGGLGWTASDKLSFYLAGIYGAEGSEKLGKGAVTLLADYKVSDKLGLHANGVYGSQETGLTVNTWTGAAVYADYMFTDEVSGIVRFENFDDSDGNNLPSGANANGDIGGQIVNEYTITLQHKKGNFIKRLEYRQDMSNRLVFQDEMEVLKDTQSTVGFELIYTF